MQIKTVHNPGQIHRNFARALTLKPILRGAHLNKVGNIVIRSQKQFAQSLTDAGFTQVMVDNSGYSHAAFCRGKTVVLQSGAEGYAFVGELTKVFRPPQAFYVVDHSVNAIYGRFYVRRSACEVQRVCASMADIMCEVGTNVEIITEQHRNFAYYAAHYTKGTEKDLKHLERALRRLSK